MANAIRRCLAVVLFLAMSFPALAREGFLLLDDIGQSGKPSTETLGFTPVRAIPTSALWPRDGDLTEPNFAAIKRGVSKHPNALGIACLDIEHWSTSTTDSLELKSNIDKLVSVVDFVHNEFPDLKVGYYGMIPVRNYNDVRRNDLPALKTWQKQNDRLRPLGEAVDIVFPSIYAFNHNAEEWKNYAIHNLLEARKYGKPVIAFLWPQVHQSSLFSKLEFVNYEFWTLQLETVYEYADGIIIWTPWGEMRTPFDPLADWWKATQDFVFRHKLNASNEGSERPNPPILSP